MKKALLILLVFGSTISNGQQYKPLYYMFSDNKARHVNDLITIVVSEQATAKNSSTNNSSASQSTNFSAGPGVGGWTKAIPLFGGSTQWKNDYKGNGTTSKNGSIQTTITAKITKVVENGNFELQGTKKLLINGEEEVITISGEVRQDDIGADNTVASSKLSNVEISYKGKGPMDDGAKAGLITRLFNWLF